VTFHLLLLRPVTDLNIFSFSLFTPRRRVWTAEVWLRSFLTSSLDGGEWLTSSSGRFPPGKNPIFIEKRLCGPQGRSGTFWRSEKSLSPSVIRKRNPPAGSQLAMPLSYTGSNLNTAHRKFSPRLTANILLLHHKYQLLNEPVLVAARSKE